MSAKSYRVHVVVDPHYGERIRNLPVGEPAWIVDSTDNHPVIRAIWQERKVHDQFPGITSFKFDPDAQPEDWLISNLSAIDLHQGEYSHRPPYSILNIIGTPWSEATQEELDRFGFPEHETTPEGFVARRKLNEQTPSCD